MIVGIGNDLIEMERVLHACEKEHFRRRYFTEKEQELIARRPKAAAGNFAVKEAVVKVFGTGFGKIEPADIEVLRDEKGAPYVNLYGAALQKKEELKITSIHVSISNTETHVSAVAIGSSDNE